jgi:peptide/nickel transport system substrate-binding protein
VLVGASIAPRMSWGQGGLIDKDLLKSVPFDRITLIDGVTVNVEPVSPRPLPPYDPKKDKTAQAKRTEDIPAEGNVPSAREEAQRKQRERGPEQINELVVHRLDDEPGDFKVRRANIRRVEYFEDFLLAEADRLMLARDYLKAFEHLILVRARDPKWKGLEEAVQKLLYEEGTSALARENDLARGLRLLRELHARRPDYPGLADRLASAFGNRINAALEQGDYREARRVLHDLESLAPTHAYVQETKTKFIAKAKSHADKANSGDAAHRLDSIAEALRVWPELEGAGARFQEAFAAMPTLDVGVIDLAVPAGPWIRSLADERVASLSYLPILARDDEDAARGRLPGQLASEMQKADLGRQLILTLRSGPSWSDDGRAVSAVDIVRSLSDRAVPSSPNFNARWAEMLERVEIVDDRQVVVRLARAPLKPESWLLGPIGPAHTGRDAQATSAEGVRRPVSDGLYAWEQRRGDVATYVFHKSDANPNAPKIQRIREHRIPRVATALNALIQGDITLLEHVPIDQVAALQKQPEIQLGRYDRPALHQIALDGRTPALRNRTLRRGLSYALDRRTFLEETLLRRPIDAANSPSDGVFAKESYANAPDVAPLGFDPLLARMLVAAGIKEMGGNAVKLTFEYPARPEARVIVPRILEALRGTGLEINAIERPESELESGLRSGRRFDLAYRVARCGEPVTDAGILLCPGYDAPPSEDALAALASSRILQLLLQLEQAPDWATARGLVALIDREVRDELPIIPLWQLEDHYAWRARLKGPKETTGLLYHEIEQWEIEPWYAKDPW